jgi:hypothetical protein
MKDNLQALFKLIEEWEGYAWTLKEDEMYKEYKKNLLGAIKE